MKQVTLATAASLALAFTAFAGGQNAPAYSHGGYNSDWATGWYIGAGVNGDANLSNQTPTGQGEWAENQESNTDFENSKNDLGFDVYVGRKVSDHFAFELGYTMVGNQKFKSTNSDDTTAKTTVEQWNVHGAGLIHWPIGDYFNVFAKGGIAYYQNETDFDNTGISPPNAKLNTFALLYGAGIELTWDQFGVRGEYTGLAPNDSDRNNFYISDVVGASIFYRFM